MRPPTAEVAQEVRIGAAGIFKGVRQDGKVVKGSLLINSLGQHDRVARLKGQV
jgi:hypothetical protein